jgi:glyoxylase-like metal-dependent hydrolase (beta-lactamase superfamily II)
MPAARLIDVMHLGRDRVIGANLVRGAIVDPGPESALDRWIDTLDHEPRALLLTHIHLDHAGAAGTMVRRFPRLRVYVHEVGAPHLVDPAKLIASAARLYGDALGPLWGEIVPVPEANVHVVGSDVVGLECFPSPGHARHHVCYVGGDGTLYAGDAAGVRIAPHTAVLPPTPPPDVDVEAWHATVAAIRRREPERLALIHFGVFDDVARHLDELERRLDEWAERVASGVDEPGFVEAGLGDVDPEAADEYAQAMPLEQSYAGLKRYVAKHAAA